jgi:hypothetical protein
VYYYSRALGNSEDKIEETKSEYGGRIDESGITFIEEGAFTYLKLSGATTELYGELSERWMNLKEEVSKLDLQTKVYQTSFNLDPLRRALLENFYLETFRCRSSRAWKKMRSQGMYRGGNLALTTHGTFPIDTKRDQIASFIEIDPKTNEFKGLSAMRLVPKSRRRYIDRKLRNINENENLIFHFWSSGSGLLDFQEPFILQWNRELAHACDKFYGNRMRYSGSVTWGRFYPYYDENMDVEASNKVDTLPMSSFETPSKEGVTITSGSGYPQFLYAFDEIPVYFPELNYEDDPYWHELKSEM